MSSDHFPALEAFRDLRRHTERHRGDFIDVCVECRRLFDDLDGAIAMDDATRGPFATYEPGRLPS